MLLIKLEIKSTKNQVSEFLDGLKESLNDEKFNIDTNFTLIRSKKEGKEEFSTQFTLLDLGYDVYDVIDRLKELTVEDYSETLLDRDNLNPPALFVFGKNINNRQVYIKLKIRNGGEKHVVCVSFHYAEFQMNFPYK